MGSSFSRVHIRSLVNTNALYGITRGTAAANKAVVTDGSTNVTGLTLTNPTFSGTVTGAITPTGIGSTQTVAGSLISATSGTTGTTLTNVTGLTVPVVAGTYAFEAYLPSVSTANSGLKIAVANSGTTTSASYTGQQWNGTTQGAHTTTTTIGNAVAAATAVTTDASLQGTIVVSGAGNLTVQFAQNASHADTTSILANSWFSVTRIA